MLTVEFFFCFTSGSTLQDKDEDPVPAETGQNHPFFRRSDSMTFLGCIPPNPFDVPLAEAIPLADQPHLLQVRSAAQSFIVRGSPETLKLVNDTQSTTYFTFNIMLTMQHQLYICMYRYDRI